MSISNIRFATMPTISITRSKFKRDSQVKTSFNLGEITPIFLDEVLPGDTRKIDLASLIRMSNPIAPIMDNIYMDVYGFFIPSRLAWTHFREFMGENNTSAGIYSGTEYTTPMRDIYATGVGVGSLGDHLGLPIVTANNSKHLYVSDLPGRCYDLIYNRWFRDQNLISPIVISLGDTGTQNYNRALYKAGKFSDYYTRALPFVQKGAPVTIPLGTSAPVYCGADNPLPLGVFTDLHWNGSSGALIKQGAAVMINDVSGNTSFKSESGFDGSRIAPANLYADLSRATSATINDLRFAFQYQKLLEKDSMYGTRYWELLYAHYGVKAPDATLQDPEFLGHQKVRINIDQVIQTTGIDQATPAQNELGAVAANSVTGNSGNLFTFSSCEFGYVMIVAVARHDQTYGQGVSRLWTRKHRTDHYFPVFANLGSQPVYNKEIFADGSSNDDLPFGYQEAWSEYRYKPSEVHGILRPNVANSLGFWTLANNFASLPTLSQSFIEQNRDNLARALATGVTGPDFIADFFIRDIAVRPMPMYSVPGLIDHH